MLDWRNDMHRVFPEDPGEIRNGPLGLRLQQNIGATQMRELLQLRQFPMGAEELSMMVHDALSVILLGNAIIPSLPDRSGHVQLERRIVAGIFAEIVASRKRVLDICRIYHIAVDHTLDHERIAGWLVDRLKDQRRPGGWRLNGR